MKERKEDRAKEDRTKDRKERKRERNENNERETELKKEKRRATAQRGSVCVQVLACVWPMGLWCRVGFKLTTMLRQYASPPIRLMSKPAT